MRRKTGIFLPLPDLVALLLQRVLCVYLRGEAREVMSERPAHGETFRVRTELFKPRSAARGVRRALDLVRRIVYRLAELERMTLKEMR